MTILAWAALAACKNTEDPDLFFEPDEEPSWQDFALCAQTDPEAFFPEKGGSAREAKKVCQGCEVRAECLEFALENEERFGVWGGLSERERRRMAGRRPALVPVAPVVEGEKVCTRCGGDPQPMTAFSADRNLPGGRKYWCKSCMTAYRRAQEGKAA